VDPDGRWTDNGDGTYTAQAGDTLSKLAKDTTGNSANWKNYGYSESQARLIKPGDVVNTRVYNTPDDAATAFGNAELGPSKTSDVEVGSSIYKLTTPDGSTKYSYTNQSAGTQHGCNPSMYSDASKIESYIHTHGAESGPSYDDENYSPQDKKYAENLSINGYVVTPSGNIKQYDSATETTRTVIDIDPATDPMP
jgi:LysM repeat protein